MSRPQRKSNIPLHIRKQYAELGLERMPNLDKQAEYSQDEYMALFYLVENQPVPDDLKEKILFVKRWELPLYRLLFDEETLVGRDDYFEPTDTIIFSLMPITSRSYIKMAWTEEPKLKQLQEKFLKSWGLSYCNRVIVSSDILEKMKKQVVNFRGYITLDVVESFMSEDREEKSILTKEGLAFNFKLANIIFSKLAKANIVKSYRYEDENVWENCYKEDIEEEDTARFMHDYVVGSLGYLPVENLEKILEMDYEKDITLRQWFFEIQKQGLLEFTPYLCKVWDTCILLVLDYNEQIRWDCDSWSFYISFSGFNRVVDNDINVKLQGFLKRLLDNHSRNDIEHTELFQILFYMCILNVGVHSRAFYDKLLGGTIKHLDEMVSILSKYSLGLEKFNFQFEKFSSFMKKEERTFQVLLQEEKVEAFRVSAYDSEEDLCRFAIYNSLKIVMEHNTGKGSDRMEFNLEPLLEQMDWLTEEEKEQMLNNRAVRNTIILFLLTVRGVVMDNVNVHIKKAFPTLPKFCEPLPVICGLNDLIL